MNKSNRAKSRIFIVNTNYKQGKYMDRFHEVTKNEYGTIISELLSLWQWFCACAGKYAGHI